MGKVTKSTIDKLDHSRRTLVDEDNAALDAKRQEFEGSDQEGSYAPSDGELSSDYDDDGNGDNADSKKSGRVGGLFKSLTRSVANITGGAVLTEEDLEPILNPFKTSLMARNVAADVATKLAESVSTSLVGRTSGRFQSMG